MRFKEVDEKNDESLEVNGSFAYNDSELIIKEGLKTRIFHFIAGYFQEVMGQGDLDNLLADYYLIKVFNEFIYLSHSTTARLVVVKRDSLQIVQNITTFYADYPRNITMNK